MHLPEEYGGGGGGLADLAVVIEECAAGGCPMQYIVISSICGPILLHHGSDVLKDRWLAGLADGTKKMCFAITEPDAGTLQQLGRYPGLVVTTHELVASGDRVAIVLSEHGASVRLAGRAAAWSGVALFRSDGERLTHCWSEEDYDGRRRQLDTGACDPVAAPAAAPWDVVPQPPDPAAEDAVRRWLAGPDLRSAPVVCDDEATGQPAERLLDVGSVEVHELWSAGDRVAFSGVQAGRYLGGLDDLDDRVGTDCRLNLAGLVQVTGGAVVGGRVVRDRLGLARVLRAG